MLVKKWRTWALVIVAALAALVAAYDRIAVVRWVGGYPVQVRFERSNSRPMSGVAAAALTRRAWDYTEGDPARIECGWEPVAASSSEPFTVHVRSWGTTSGLGRTISYQRQEVLVLKVSYADGGSEVVVASLPDSLSSRELIVRGP